jgi:hypothetical protein
MYALVPLQELVAAHMATYKDFPARTGGGSFTPKQ